MQWREDWITECTSRAVMCGCGAGVGVLRQAEVLGSSPFPAAVLGVPEGTLAIVNLPWVAGWPFLTPTPTPQHTHRFGALLLEAALRGVLP